MNVDTEQPKKNSKIPSEYRTHGEKMYDLVFNQGFNFWANLLISAGFTYWVYHSKVPIWKGAENFGKGETTQNILKAIKFGGYAVGGGMAIDSVLRGEKNGEERKIGDRINEALSGAAIAGMGHAIGSSTKVVQDIFRQRPNIAHKWVQKGIYNTPMMDMFGAKVSPAELDNLIFVDRAAKLPTRLEVSKFMADALTLTAVGTFVMIPGVWGAEKIKGDFVRWQDKMHYGKDAESQSWIKERHEVLAEQKRPTLIGYGVGRLGSMAAVQAAAYTFGHGDKNLIKWIGEKANLSWLKKFGGTDNLAAEAGDAIGSAFARVMPESAKMVAKQLHKNYGWSDDQVRFAWEYAAHMQNNTPHGLNEEQLALAKRILDDITLDPTNQMHRYNRHFQDFGKYVGMDTIYTAITAGTIVPFTGWLKQNVPGLSYSQNDEKPQNRVSSVERESTVEQPALKAAR